VSTAALHSVNGQVRQQDGSRRALLVDKVVGETHGGPPKWLSQAKRIAAGEHAQLIHNQNYSRSWLLLVSRHDVVLFFRLLWRRNTDGASSGWQPSFPDQWRYGVFSLLLLSVAAHIPFVPNCFLLWVCSAHINPIFDLLGLGSRREGESWNRKECGLQIVFKVCRSPLQAVAVFESIVTITSCKTSIPYVQDFVCADAFARSRSLEGFRWRLITSLRSLWFSQQIHKCP